MTNDEMSAHTKRIADENIALADAGVTMVVILTDEKGMSLAVRGNRELAMYVVAEAARDIAEDQGWHQAQIRRA